MAHGRKNGWALAVIPVLVALGIVALLAGIAVPIQVRWRRQVREAQALGWVETCEPGVTPPAGSRRVLAAFSLLYPDLAWGRVRYVAAPWRPSKWSGPVRGYVTDARLHEIQLLPDLGLLRHELTELSCPEPDTSPRFARDLARLTSASG